MFDLRPCNEEGGLDLQKIQRVGEFLDLRQELWIKKEAVKRLQQVEFFKHLKSSPNLKKKLRNKSLADKADVAQRQSNSMVRSRS